MNWINTIKKDKKVGLLIHSGAQLFSNGILQNAYFITQCLEAIGMKCEFLCYEDSPKPFDYKQIPLKKFSTNPLEFDPSEYNTIITITRGMDQSRYNMLKKHNVAVVGFVCGNSYMHDQEDFVRGLRGESSTFVSKTSMVDELWVIPSYHHALEYLEIVRGKPAFIIPHLWSSELMRESTKTTFNKPESELFYNTAVHTKKKIDILILEPNMALFKTAWMPIIASEKLFQMYPDILNNVYVFNFPDHTNSGGMADALSLGKKLRRFKRISIPQILLAFNKNDSVPIIISHQVLNSLNYLYYELLFYGYPLVHNSPDLDGCGYYYPENNIGKCVESIMHAFKHHNKNIDTYKEKADKYLERVDPLHPTMGKIWNQMINDVLIKANASAPAAAAAAAPAAAPAPTAAPAVASAAAPAVASAAAPAAAVANTGAAAAKKDMQFHDEKGKRIDTATMERIEQEQAEEFITPDCVVLELGARYGSVSCIINKKIANPRNQVSVEPDARVWNALETNMRANGCEFHIVKGFVSRKVLALTNLDAWYGGYGATFSDTSASDIPSYSLEEIESMHNLSFNTLVADCEGFLERFFDENPHLYKQLKLVMYEEDNRHKCDYKKIAANLTAHGFRCIVSGFHSVWKKPDTYNGAK